MGTQDIEAGIASELVGARLAEHSGVFTTPESIGMVEMPTVEDIDALPAPEDLRLRRADAVLAGLDEDAQVALMLQRLCHLSDENVGRIGHEALRLLGNKAVNAKAVADEARSVQHAAEFQLKIAIGEFADFRMQKAG